MSSYTEWASSGHNSSAVPQPQCPFCGCVPSHPPEACFEVKAIEYHPNGTIKRVEKRDGSPTHPSIY